MVGVCCNRRYGDTCQKFNIPKITIFTRNHLFQTIILGIHVSFRGCKLKIYTRGGGFKYHLLSSLVGEIIQFDEHIFQMG